MKLIKFTVPIIASGMMWGCISLPHKAQYSKIYLPVIQKEVTINNAISENRAINAIISEMNNPTSVTGVYQEHLIDTFESNGAVPGTINTYDLKGVKVERLSGQPNKLKYVYYDTELSRDSRGNGPLYNRLTGSTNTMIFTIGIKKKGHKTYYTISSAKDGYSERFEDGFFSPKTPLTSEQLTKDIQERFSHMNIRIPRKVVYTGEVTLKNDDVTAFANIQRHFKNSYVSTNNKTDSEKSGSFVLPHSAQRVEFALYPYKKVAKVQYKFEYTYYYNGKGGSSFDRHYKQKTAQSMAREFNR